jgi:hypothetical protein
MAVRTLVLKQCSCEEDTEKLVPKRGSFEDDSENTGSKTMLL